MQQLLVQHLGQRGGPDEALQLVRGCRQRHRVVHVDRGQPLPDALAHPGLVQRCEEALRGDDEPARHRHAAADQLPEVGGLPADLLDVRGTDLCELHDVGQHVVHFPSGSSSECETTYATRADRLRTRA